jgi:hypothetical protein
MASLANHPDETLETGVNDKAHSRIKIPAKYLQRIQAKNPVCADCGASCMSFLLFAFRFVTYSEQI